MLSTNMFDRASSVGVMILVVATAALVVVTEGNERAVGTVWPRPQKQILSEIQFRIEPNRLFFRTSSTCDIVTKAIRRYSKLIFPQQNAAVSDSTTELSTITLVDIQVEEFNDCQYPQDGMNETYTLSVFDEGVFLSAPAPWGVLRGLETFSQLVYFDENINSYLINMTMIVDWPRFGFRGVLLDTSRHYLPIKVLKQNLDAMAFNKFNVFHWHIVDDPSWPLQMQTYSNLTEAAYHPRLVYSQQDIKDIIEFARLRGIRVLPEVDTPGHTAALGKILPEILTPCTKGRAVLNAARQQTYEVVTSILEEINKLFVDNFIHLGMDEVDYTCWKHSAEIGEFMKRNNLSTYSAVEDYYVRKTLDAVRQFGTKYILWQDPINNGVKPASDAIVGVWLDHYSNPNGKKHGYKIILSAPWYLNYISYGEDWQKFYEIEPTEYPAIKAESDLLIGGEACMWGEFVDATNVLPRMWPRASAVAERLWSSNTTVNVHEAKVRLDEQRCRMYRRGLPAQPLNVGYCGGFEASN